MTGYLFARAGLRVVVLEKHADFLRDFRGDTVHPSTLRILDELGLLDEFLQRPHQKLRRIGGQFGAERVALGDFSRLGERYGFIAFMPQWEFLNFLLEKGRALPGLRVCMRSEVVGLLKDASRITGVRVKTPEATLELKARLLIGADGRHSLVRSEAGLKVIDLGAPIDVLWFRIGRDPASFDEDFTHLDKGRIIITIDRGDYWQCAYVIPKGGADAEKAKGIEAFREEVCQVVPTLRPHMGDIRSWDNVKLLTVAVDRLLRWSRPGLLCIGDAAHAMSPVGGVGINLAIQDAVATANLLSGPLKAGDLTDADLDRVRQRRLLPTRLVQGLQILMHEQILAPVLSRKNEAMRPPLIMRLLTNSGWLRGLTARFLGFGVRAEHVRSAEKPLTASA
jgi:2-polyprenyl-6-methoxyphenol hydroxylase-like FAD-dependent oxidoreductase